MGQYEIVQFLKENPNEKFTSRQIAMALRQTSGRTSRCTNRISGFCGVKCEKIKSNNGKTKHFWYDPNFKFERNKEIQ